MAYQDNDDDPTNDDAIVETNDGVIDETNDKNETTSTNQPEGCKITSDPESNSSLTETSSSEVSEQQRRNFLCVQTSLMILSVLSLASSPGAREEGDLSNRG